jgi:hypothetical protein
MSKCNFYLETDGVNTNFENFEEKNHQHLFILAQIEKSIVRKEPKHIQHRHINAM